MIKCLNLKIKSYILFLAQCFTIDNSKLSRCKGGSMAGKSSGCGKWFSGVAATVIGAVAIWALTRPGGIINPPTATPRPTEPPPTAPPAPTLDRSLFSSNIVEEKQELLTIGPGEEYPINVMDIFFIPNDNSASCASGFLIMSWIIQVPYPTDGNNLEIRSIVHSGGGLTERIGSGSQGTFTVGYCSEISFINLSPTDTYKIQIRYAAGIYR